jgi:chemotaxis protein CheC
MPVTIDLRKLRVINDLITESANTVRAQLETMADLDAEVSVTGLTFLDPSDLGDHIGQDPTYAASVPLDGPPYGVFCITIAAPTARNLAGHMTGTEVAGDLNQLQESALKELTNILASGFLDGVANTLETEIPHGTPTLRRDTGSDIADQIRSPGYGNSMLFLVNTAMEIEGEEPNEVTFYLIPDAGSFALLLDQLDADE